MAPARMTEKWMQNPRMKAYDLHLRFLQIRFMVPTLNRVEWKSATSGFETIFQQNLWAELPQLVLAHIFWSSHSKWQIGDAWNLCQRLQLQTSPLEPIGSRTEDEWDKHSDNLYQFWFTNLSTRHFQKTLWDFHSKLLKASDAEVKSAKVDWNGPNW